MFLESHPILSEDNLKLGVCFLGIWSMCPLVMFCAVALAVLSTVLCIMQIAWMQRRGPRSHCPACFEPDCLCWDPGPGTYPTVGQLSGLICTCHNMGMVRVTWDGPHKAIRTGSLLVLSSSYRSARLKPGGPRRRGAM